LITFARAPAIKLWEVSVKPIGFDGGEKIKLSNMHNTSLHTFAPRKLKMLTDATMKVFYDPAALVTLLDTILNMKDTITERYSDGSTYAYFGVMNKFERDEHQEGEVPTATVSFFATNRDSSGVEQVPVLTEVIGT
jgi:hypothetical protein